MDHPNFLYVALWMKRNKQKLAIQASTLEFFFLGQIKNISVFQVMGLKILGRVGTHFFSDENNILCILKGILPFKMHKIIFFSEDLNLFSRFHQ